MTMQKYVFSIGQINVLNWDEIHIPNDILNITSMLSIQERKLLYILAKYYWGARGVIVDGGCFVGGSTLSLALGLVENKNYKTGDKVIHSYDLFIADDHQVQKYLSRHGNFKFGDSIRSLFEHNISRINSTVNVHEGDICSYKWTGQDIEILFIDVAKTWNLNDHIVQNFFPFLIPDHSIVIQQDFVYPACPWLAITMEFFSDYFEIIGYVPNNTIVFKLTKQIPKSLINQIAISKLQNKDKIRLIERALTRYRTILNKDDIIELECAKVILLLDIFGKDIAIKALERIYKNYDKSPRFFNAIKLIHSSILNANHNYFGNSKNNFIAPSLSPYFVDKYWIRQTILNALKEFLTKCNGILLDVGCGEMPYKQFIVKNKNITKYIGMDIENPLYQKNSKPDVFWDGKRIPLDDNYVDCAIATEVFEHLPDIESVLKEIKRVLKPGGMLFFTVPFLWPLHDMPNDEYRYTPFSLKRHLENAGFSDIKIEALGGWDASLAQMIGLWLMRKPMSPKERAEMINIFYPLYEMLIKNEELSKKPSFDDMLSNSIMITGLTGTALKIDRDYAEIQKMLDKKDYESTLIMLKDFIKTHPNHAIAHNDLGTLYYLKEEIKSALKHILTAINIEPENKDIQDNLLLILRELLHDKSINQETLAFLEEFTESANKNNMPSDIYEAIEEVISKNHPVKFKGVYCPVCNSRLKEFSSYGIIPRPNAICPNCHSLERHRLLWLYLHRKTNFFTDRLKVLDIAPVKGLSEKMRALHNIDYMSIDLSSGLAIRHMDITEMDFPDNTFDCVICYHVFEHIADDKKAMHEIFRVMKPGGWAILQVPIDENLKETLEGAHIVDLSERKRLFGQEDHVRYYGLDYKDRLEETGFRVYIDNFAFTLKDWECFYYGLIRENIFLCIKNKKSSDNLLSHDAVKITNFGHSSAKNIVVVVNGFPSTTETFILEQITGLIDLGFNINIWALNRPEDVVLHPQITQYSLLNKTTYLKLPQKISDKYLEWLNEFMQLNPNLNLSSINLIHVHFGINFNLLKPLFMNISQPIVVSFHGVDASQYIKIHGQRCYDALFDRANLITTPSYIMKEKLISIGCSSQKIKVHRCGVNLKHFYSITRQNKEKFIFLTVARLVEKKGLYYSISAFSRLKTIEDIQFRIVGSGPMLTTLRNLCKDLEIENKVLFLGHQDKDSVIKEMQNADVFVLTSVTASNGDQEGLPVSLIEAQACGLPVITSHHSGIPELIIDNETGFLCKERDIDCIAEKMMLFFNDETIRKRFSEAAINNVKKEFDLQELNLKLKDYYDILIKHKSLQ